MPSGTKINSGTIGSPNTEQLMFKPMSLIEKKPTLLVSLQSSFYIET
jgi:hypothetical protein